jgi:uncharacterized protein (UPF0297 family)
VIDYVKFRLDQALGKSTEEQMRIIEDVYKELESKGYNHFVAYAMVSKVISDNIKESMKNLNEIFEKFKREKEV